MGSEPMLDVTSLGLQDELAAEHSEECCGKQCVAMATKRLIVCAFIFDSIV